MSKMDRAVGALLGSALGDATAVPYEFGPPQPSRDLLTPLATPGGGPFHYPAGSWSDDTDMALVIAGNLRVVDHRMAAGLDEIVEGWIAWAAQTPDVGNQTGSVLRSAQALIAQGVAPAQAAAQASRELHDSTGHTAGNGALMRTTPLALAYLADTSPERAMVNAQRIAGLTHYDKSAGISAALWTAMIWRAMRTHTFDPTEGLNYLDDQELADSWLTLIDEALTRPSSEFPKNGWTVHAFQAALSIVNRAWHHSEMTGQERFTSAVNQAISDGGDTDTVATIAGGLLGALVGYSGLPSDAVRTLRSHDGSTTFFDLIALAHAVRAPQQADYGVWPNAPRHDYPNTLHKPIAAHPYDEKVLLGQVHDLDDLPDEVTAVVSLCRIGREQIVRPGAQAFVWLIDDGFSNPDPEATIHDAAVTIKRMRDEGHTVLVHCVQSHSRTPTVAAAYGMLITPNTEPDQMLNEMVQAVRPASPNPRFREALRNLGVLATAPHERGAGAQARVK